MRRPNLSARNPASSDPTMAPTLTMAEKREVWIVDN